jgi:Fe2+ transport system protein FeoA
VHDSIPLELLTSGTTGIVDEVVGGQEAVLRLEELGLRKGQAVEMVQPGSPCIIRVSGHKLCIRDGDAFAVLVRPESFQ